MKALVLLTWLTLIGMSASAQKGTIRGSVIDDKTGEGLIGVNVILDGTLIGTSTDLDGKFSFPTEAGTYTLAITYISFTGQKVNDVVVKAGEVTLVDPIRLVEESQMLEAVEVTAKALQNSEAALMTIKKKSANFLDGISAQTFSRTGDGDAAAAIKRVTGVTVEGGKYVYVRGLGGRYSKTIVNGMEIPGLDPERNTVQMDIFPTNALDNIVVYKTFTPDLPGDFTGGMVDITTKDFPERKTLKISGSLGYNTETHFSDEFILYEGSRLDALGFGKDSRKLPFIKSYEPDKNDASTLFTMTNSLNKEIDVKKMNNFFDQSYSLSYGNQSDLDKVTLGYVLSINYKNTYEFRENNVQSEVVLNADNGSEEGYNTEFRSTRKGSVGINESLWSMMGSGSLKKNKSKVSLKYFHTQSGEKSASSRINEDFFNALENLETNLDYFQRMISYSVLSGEHVMGKNSQWSVNWANAFTKTNISNPDRVSSSFTLEGSDTLFTSGSSNLDKVYRELNEWNNNTKISTEFRFGIWNGNEAKFKAGLANIYKDRNDETYTVSIGKSNNFSPQLSNVTGSLNTILEEENLYSEPGDVGYLINSVQVDAENKYSASQNIMASFLMVELPVLDNVNFIGGLRIEHAVMTYNGVERLSGDPIEKKVLNSVQYLPSANFVFGIMKDMNLRTSYSKTLARPSFKEKSEGIIYDPISNVTFYGNLDLQESEIHNADLRWEYFFGNGEIIALSYFYKRFNNPIEIQPLENSGPNNLRPVNRDQADVFGIELEFRKDFGFISDKMKGLSLGTNFSYIKSKIDLSEDQKEKYTFLNQPIPANRGLQGQSPFAVNAVLAYSHPVAGSELSLSYNLKGKTLMVVGIGTIPDIYEDPFHNLDIKFSQDLGKNKRAKLSLSAKNLIGDNSKMVYEYLGSDIATYRSYERGRSFSIGFSYDIM